MLNLQRSARMACIAAMALTVFSCNNEELVERPVLKGNTTIVATIGGGGSSTRTTINDKYQILWQAEDAFGMFDEDNSLTKFSYASGAGTTTATFTGDIATGEQGAYAVFPYKETMTINDGTLTMELPAQFTYITASNGPMYAKVEEDNLNQLSFKHMAALIKLTVNKIPAEATTFKITASNYIAGTCTANLKEEYPVLKVSSGDEASNEVIVTLPAETETTRIFFVPLPIGTYDYITAELTDGNDKTFFTKTINNQTLERSNILVLPALDCVTIEATTPSAINTELANNISAPTTEEEVKTTDVLLTGKIDVTSDGSAIEIPVSKNSNVNLAFTSVPKTSDAQPLELKDKDLSGDDSPVTAVNKISVSVPETNTGAGDDAEAPSVKIDMPKTTVELGSVGKSASYKKVIAKTATSTLIVKAGVTVEELEIEGGNVEIYGTVKKLTVSPNNGAAKITVKSGGPADIQAVEDNENKFEFSSVWDGVSRTESIPQGGKIYTAAQLASLQGTPDAAAVSGTKYPEATTTNDITLCGNINLRNHQWVGIVLGEGHTFDGGKHTVDSIMIKEGSYLDKYSNRDDHSSAGFIGAALLNSSVKDLTVQNVTIGDKETALKWAGALVGYSHGAKAYSNCKAEHVKFDCNGNGLSFRVGGLIGYIQQNTNLVEAVTIDKCSVNDANLAADFSYGGLLGSLWDSVTLTDCETSEIKLGSSGCTFNHGYCSNFIGDAVNAASAHERKLIITNCTVSNGTVSNGDSELGFGLVPYEQRHVGKYSANDQNVYLGYTDGDAKFSITIDNVNQTEGTHYNIYSGDKVSYWDGKTIKAPSKTKDQPIYTIKTAAELAWVAQQVNKGTDFTETTFNMVNDMDLENRDWTPIGNNNENTEINVKETDYRTNVKFFKGTFDGGNHSISNLTVDHPTPGSGLFGNMQNAVIKNFTVNKASINGAGKWTAVVIGYAYEGLTVENVHVESSSINMTNPQGAVKLAGVVSFASGALKGDVILKGCTVTDLAINGGYCNHGGLAGYIFQAKLFNVENCKVKNISIKVTENTDPNLPNKANYCSAFIGCFNNTNSPTDPSTAKFTNNEIEGYYKFDGSEAKLSTFEIANASDASNKNYADFVCAPWFGDSDAKMPITINDTTYEKKDGKYVVRGN